MKYTDYSEIKTCGDTLKKCSYDKSRNEYMSESGKQVFNFDKIKMKYLNRLHMSEEKAKSVDALVEGKSERFYLIEFKNGNCKSEKVDIQLKFRDSLLILCDICHCRISDTRQNMTIVLVINEEHAGLTALDLRAIGLSQKSGKPCSFLDLNKMQGVYFENVLVYEKKAFDIRFTKKLL